VTGTQATTVTATVTVTYNTDHKDPGTRGLKQEGVSATPRVANTHPASNGHSTRAEVH